MNRGPVGPGRRSAAEAAIANEANRSTLARAAAALALSDPDFAEQLRVLCGSTTAGSQPAPDRAKADAAGPAASSSTSGDSAAGADFCMVGSSPPMLRLFERIRRCAASHAPVLVAGESGTGKELAARAIHELSARAHGPLITINCAALPATLIASELFGYEKGAFTGASTRKIGRLEAADTGTVFLDEIGDLPLDLQGHLLRFLQEKVIERVGGNKPIALDVRVVAATNVSLHEAVRRGAFRDDLFYRLHVLTLEMPPLRARADDVVLLAMATLRHVEREVRGIKHEFDPDAIQVIRAHDWPGNVRELIACIRRAVVYATGPCIRASDLGIVPSAQQRGAAKPADVVREPSSGANARDGRNDADRIREVLFRHGYNIKRASMAYGVSRVTMYRLIEKFGVEIARRPIGRLPAPPPPAANADSPAGPEPSTAAHSPSSPASDDPAK